MKLAPTDNGEGRLARRATGAFFGRTRCSASMLLQSATQRFNVTNRGNATANVTLVAGQPRSLADGGTREGGSAEVVRDAAIDGADAGDAPGGTAARSPFSTSIPVFSIAAGGTQAQAATFAPTAANATSASIFFVVTDPICAPLAAPIPVSGIGIGGGPTVAPTSIAFSGNCGGGAPAPQTFTVANKGNANLTWAMSAPTGNTPGNGPDRQRSHHHGDADAHPEECP
jgi:hypothetical protein